MNVQKKRAIERHEHFIKCNNYGSLVFFGQAIAASFCESYIPPTYSFSRTVYTYLPNFSVFRELNFLTTI